MPIHSHEHPTLVRIANFHRHAVPRVPDGDGPLRPSRRLVVFGVGTDWIQLTWSRLGPGLVRVRCGDHASEFLADGGPGSHVISGLPSGVRHVVELTGDGIVAQRETREAETLPVPPGEELFRLATVSDAHVGSNATGYFRTMAEIPPAPVPHAVRCLRAAQSEAVYWGARHLIVKGDLVDESDREKWSLAADVLDALSIPVDLIPGNHEAKRRGTIEPAVGAANVGLRLVDGVRTIDRDGVRMILADTSRPGKEMGDLRHGPEILASARETDAPVFVALHHQLTRHLVPTYVPLGIPQPSSRRFLRSLGAANPRTIVSSGHTHRHRRYDLGPVTVTEVGSTKDYPGTWAGYQVFEGGVVQTVRRIGEPSVIRWTDHTRLAAGGAWALWAPGPLDSRCFTRRW
ncbi:metallophosphoesterase family protein [Actinospongicola halichondriae]|uniref:metallophosphoesterase family protein n=1 Tax=Actinospongicola halichondriae TaxID=3236844 RepID=UPI003D49601F